MFYKLFSILFYSPYDAAKHNSSMSCGCHLQFFQRNQLVTDHFKNSESLEKQFSQTSLTLWNKMTLWAEKAPAQLTIRRLTKETVNFSIVAPNVNTHSRRGGEAAALRLEASL